MKIENEQLLIEVDPAHGGRIIRFYDKKRKTEQLWYDSTRLPVNPALDYDGNFAGGMDELLPNDPPENGFPDHGELWMTSLACKMHGNKLDLHGVLPISHLAYQRTMYLDGNSLISQYRIRNAGKETIHFLWKLHAALKIEQGDILRVPAGCVQAADPGDWSKAADGMPRRWHDSYKIGEMDGTADFFFLTDLRDGELVLKRKNGGLFSCQIDLKTFPNVWIFASFGRLNNSRTLIMEPCTNYPLTLADAAKQKVCAALKTDEEIKTTVRWTVQ